jgi:triosephosphate isomerase
MEKIVVGNLKMNLLSPTERDRYLSLFKKELDNKNLNRTEIILCPSFVHLDGFHSELGKEVKLGAQNIFWEREGSFTGEISPSMVKNFGCEYVIIGHSERRKYFGETNEVINIKINAALKVGLRPIICVGESKAEKGAMETMRVVTKQVKEALRDVNRTKLEQIIITYEPIWAVGTDVTPTANEIMEAKLLIRKILVEMFDKKYAKEVKLLYGGSVNAKIVEEVCLEPGMDGVLIGRESLAPFEFLKIAEIINNG